MSEVRIVGQPPDYAIKEIAITLRASKEYSGRGWRTIELSAKADVLPGGNAEYAHNELYESLRQRISLLLNENGRG